MPKKHNNRILEIGTGMGATLIKAKELGLAEEVVGIDIEKVENNIQSESKIDRFIVGDIEALKLDFENDYFDVIICADVLEHLVDPWKTLERLTIYLKKGGVFISSIPNVRNFRVLLSIALRGDFQYTDSGILDRSHLRFFCKNNIIKMFQENGYDILSIKTNMGAYGLKHKLINFLTFGMLKDFFVFQYCTVAQKR